MPRSFMTSMMISVWPPPIWKPKLPPSTRIAAGAPQPARFWRQTAYPRPNLAPMPSAACFIPGTMTMQCAVSSNSCGTPLSGVAMISLKSLVASDNCSCAVSAANRTTDEQSDNASANLRISDLVSIGSNSRSNIGECMKAYKTTTVFTFTNSRIRECEDRGGFVSLHTLTDVGPRIAAYRHEVTYAQICTGVIALFIGSSVRRGYRTGAVVGRYQAFQ